MHTSKILITGGAGFIGSNLIDALINQYQIVNVDDFNDFYDPALKEKNITSHLSAPNYTLCRVDINDFQSLGEVFAHHQFDQVIHLAARAGVRPSIENPLAYAQTNIIGTLNLLELIKKHQVKKFIFASSSSVYGNHPAEKFSENLNLSQPISPYAATKLAAEQLIYTYAHLYQFQALCLRFFTVYGPRQRPDLAINKFISLINRNQAISVFGDGQTLRDYTYIDDIVSGIIAAMEYNSSHYEIINLGGGSPVTLSQMIATIEQAMNKKALINHLPPQAGDVDRTAADISKAQKLLSYKPATSFPQGIKQYLAWRAQQI